MARIQEHKFVDLSKPTEKKHDEETRRSFLRKAGGIAALTAMAPQAFARNFIDKYDADGPIARYPNPDVIDTNPPPVGPGIPDVLPPTIEPEP